MNAIYERLNKNPRPVEFIEDATREDGGALGFYFEGTAHFMEDFLRTRTPWTGDDFPEFIHGIEATNYFHPLFVEIVDGGDAVNVYRYREAEEA